MVLLVWATGAHTSNLTSRSCISLCASATIDSWFGPQEDRVFSFGGKNTRAKERRCLACNDMPWDYSILFHSRTVIPLPLFTLGWPAVWKGKSFFRAFLFGSPSLSNFFFVFCKSKFIFSVENVTLDFLFMLLPFSIMLCLCCVKAQILRQQAQGCISLYSHACWS